MTNVSRNFYYIYFVHIKGKNTLFVCFLYAEQYTITIKKYIIYNIQISKAFEVYIFERNSYFYSARIHVSDQKWRERLLHCYKNCIKENKFVKPVIRVIFFFIEIYT